MSRGLLVVTAALLCAICHAQEVQLVKGAETLKVLINGEVFTTYNTQSKWKKPYFQPVSAPGGWKVFRDEFKQPAPEHAPGNKVFVAQEHAELRVFDKVVGHAEYGEVLEATEVQDTQLYIGARNGWIRTSDVVPVKAMVTRIVQEQPMEIADKSHPLYYDHPHHKGVWFSIDEVNEIKFWKEDGRIKNVSVEVLQSEGSPAVFRVVNQWQKDDGSVVVVETSTVMVFANRLMVFDAKFTADQVPVTFADTKEGLLAIRLPNSMREHEAHGPVVNAEGEKTTATCWGKTTNWIDYTGPVGTQMWGVTLMDHPQNFRRSRYHVRDYGLFSMSPFGEAAYTNGQQPAAPVTLSPGESLAFRYGLFVHGGDSMQGAVADAYAAFTQVPAAE